MERLHATSVIVDHIGLLLVGRSGAGKSDLALRLIDDGALLVADDQVEVQACSGRLQAKAPTELFGLIEVRGIGLVRMAAAVESGIGAIIELVGAQTVERLPVPSTMPIDGVQLPRYWLAPFESSAPAKVRLIVRGLHRNSACCPEAPNSD